jgi:hypothetical protein
VLLRDLIVWQTLTTGLGLLNSAFDMSEEDTEPDKKKKALPPRKFRKLSSEMKVGGMVIHAFV